MADLERYGQAAMAGILDDFAGTAGSGERNNLLNAAAYRAGRLVAAGALEGGQAADALQGAAAAAGLSPAEARATVRSGLEAGQRSPAELPEAASRQNHRRHRARRASRPPAGAQQPVKQRPARRPPQAEVEHLWSHAHPVLENEEVSAYLTGRGIPPERVELHDLARALPKNLKVPRWAVCRGIPWSASHRLVVRGWSATGQMESLHARSTGEAPEGLDKALWPAAGPGSVKGLVMADPAAQLLLAGKKPEVIKEVVIGEGLPDFLTWTTEYSDGNEDAPAVIGVTSGGWSQAHASSFADGFKVHIATHNDKSGDQYAEKIAATFQGRDVELRRWLQPKNLGLNDANDVRMAGHRLDLEQSEVITVPEPDAQEWEPPAAFARVAVPHFPTELLPGWLAEQAEAVATFSQTPPDMAAMAGLAALSCAAMGRWDIEAPEGYQEPLCLYTVAIAPPAERKSGVFRPMAEPLVEWEQEKVESQAPALAEAKAERAVQERRRDHLQGKAAKEDDPLERRQLTAEVSDLARELLETEPAAPFRLLAEDMTPEALVALLAEQQGSLTLLSTEGGIFDIAAGLYSNGHSNLDGLLKAHDAEPIRVDRRGRPPLQVDRATLTIGLAVQPVVLEGVAANKRFRGRGLVGRFLFSLPLSLVGCRYKKGGSPPPPVPQKVKESYSRNLRALLELEPSKGRPGVLRCSPNALDLFYDFTAELEPRLAQYGGDLAPIGDWAGKLAGTLARIAGLFHLAEHLDRTEFEPVRSETMRRALALGPYFIDHALAAFSMMGADPEINGALKVLRWLEHRATESFTAKQAFDGLRAPFGKMAKLWPVLELLEEHGYIRELPPEDRPGKRGRKPSPRYLVNPLNPPEVA